MVSARLFLVSLFVAFFGFSQAVWSMARPPVEQQSELRFAWQEVGTTESRQVKLINHSTNNDMIIDSIDLPTGFSHDLSLPATVVQNKGETTFNVSVTSGTAQTLKGPMTVEWSTSGGDAGRLQSWVSATLVTQSEYANAEYKWASSLRFGDNFPLYRPLDSAASADGKSLYVLDDLRRLVVFDLLGSGQLGFRESFRHDDQEDFSLLNKHAVAVTPDSEQVLVVTNSELLVFTRDTSDGSLTFDQSISGSGFNGGYELAISDDGDTIIVCRASELHRLTRNTTSNAITYQDSVSMPSGNFCSYVAVTNSQAFASSESGGVVEVFNADEAGITHVQTLDGNGSNAVTDGARQIAVVDDAFPRLYVPSNTGHLSVFEPGTGDTWTYSADFNTLNASVVSVAPSGETVFVAAREEVRVYGRDTGNGSISYTGNFTTADGPLGDEINYAFSSVSDNGTDYVLLGSKSENAIVPIDESASTIVSWQSPQPAPLWYHEVDEMAFTGGDRVIALANGQAALFQAAANQKTAEKLGYIPGQFYNGIEPMTDSSFLAVEDDRVDLLTWSEGGGLVVDQSLDMTGETAEPDGLALHPSGETAAIYDEVNDVVQLVNTDGSGSWIAGNDYQDDGQGGTIADMELPTDAAFSDDGDFLYVLSKVSQSVNVFSFSTGQLTRESAAVHGLSGLSFPDNPQFLALSADNSELYVGGNDYVTVFSRDSGDGSLSHEITLDSGTVGGLSASHGLIANPGGGFWAHDLFSGIQRVENDSGWTVTEELSWTDTGLSPAISRITDAAISDDGQFLLLSHSTLNQLSLFQGPKPPSSGGAGGGGGGGGGGSIPLLLLAGLGLLGLRRRK